jgi:hypothetical protein
LHRLLQYGEAVAAIQQRDEALASQQGQVNDYFGQQAFANTLFDYFASL